MFIALSMPSSENDEKHKIKQRLAYLRALGTKLQMPGPIGP